MRYFGVVLAGGSGSRMGVSKIFLPCGAFSVLERSVMPFLQDDRTDEIIVVLPKEDFENGKNILSKYTQKPITCIVSGQTRTASSRLAILALKDIVGEVEKGEVAVAIHDGARPYLTLSLLSRIYDAVGETGGVIPVVKVVDTIRDENGTLNRDSLVAVQTPQCFDFYMLEKAISTAGDFTDDGSLFEKVYGKITLIEGEPSNKKLTYPCDIPQSSHFLIGLGEDLHLLVEGRKLMLGGLEIPHIKGTLGHSDGDPLLHAVADAILSALHQEDIGALYPPTNPDFKDIPSTVILHEVLARMHAEGYTVNNLSVVVHAQEPKLSPHRRNLECNLAYLLDIDAEDVGITFKTGEKVGTVGNGEAIYVSAIVSLIGE